MLLDRKNELQQQENKLQEEVDAARKKLEAMTAFVSQESDS